MPTNFWEGFTWLEACILLIIPLCLATCDGCSDCRSNAKSMYCADSSEGLE